MFKAALSTLFQPDLLNYAVLGNIDPQLHMHIVPRYKTNRVFAGVIFQDKNWGRNYSPYNKDYELAEDVFKQIVEVIKGKMV